jgi:hypothetical protein
MALIILGLKKILLLRHFHNNLIRFKNKQRLAFIKFFQSNINIFQPSLRGNNLNLTNIRRRFQLIFLSNNHKLTLATTRLKQIRIKLQNLVELLIVQFENTTGFFKREYYYVSVYSCKVVLVESLDLVVDDVSPVFDFVDLLVLENEWPDVVFIDHLEEFIRFCGFRGFEIPTYFFYNLVISVVRLHL